MKPYESLLIALPTVSRGMKSGTAISVAQTVRALTQNGIHVDLHNIDSAEIVTARDMFANILLHSGRWDGMLFIDSDMGFDAELPLKLLGRGVDVAAAACPRRTLDFGRLISAAKTHGDLSKARAYASDFTVNFAWDSKEKRPGEVRDGFCKAAAVGMAIALISKAALEAMVSAKVVERRPDLNASDGATCWSFFGNVQTGNRRLGEDYSFCYRWTKLMGRDLHVCVDQAVSHYGDFDYSARFADLL